MKNNIVFYESLAGNCPVEKYLENLPTKHHAKVVRNLKLLEEFGSYLKGGLVAYIQDDIWELRTRFGKDISRILYFSPMGNTIVLLHGFTKKTQKTPSRMINTAKARMSKYTKENNSHENTTGTH